MNEAIGTIGVICPAEAPLLGFFSRDARARDWKHRGRRSVRGLSSDHRRSLPAVRYQRSARRRVEYRDRICLAALKPLAEHDDVDAIWCFGDEANAAAAKAMSVGNLKQVWTNEGRAIDWFNPKLAEGRWFLEHATQVKNIWVPYGE
jgi:aldehyde dehydrogenase (NAD+)